MNLLDENIHKSERLLLQKWGVAVRHIGYNIAEAGVQDEQIIPLLLSLRRPTLFTLDLDFYKRKFNHARYCLVYMEVKDYEAAKYIRRVLRHPEFSTEAKRMGCVIRAEPSGLTVWRLRSEIEEHLAWVP